MDSAPETDHICPDPSGTSHVFPIGLFLTLSMTGQQSQLNQQMQLDKLHGLITASADAGGWATTIYIGSGELAKKVGSGGLATTV